MSAIDSFAVAKTDDSDAKTDDSDAKTYDSDAKTDYDSDGTTVDDANNLLKKLLSDTKKKLDDVNVEYEKSVVLRKAAEEKEEVDKKKRDIVAKEYKKLAKAIEALSEKTPQASDEVPQASDEVPQASDEVPQVSDEVPQVSDKAPQADPNTRSNGKKPIYMASSVGDTTPAVDYRSVAQTGLNNGKKPMSYQPQPVDEEGFQMRQSKKRSSSITYAKMFITVPTAKCKDDQDAVRVLSDGMPDGVNIQVNHQGLKAGYGGGMKIQFSIKETDLSKIPYREDDTNQTPVKVWMLENGLEIRKFEPNHKWVPGSKFKYESGSDFGSESDFGSGSGSKLTLSNFLPKYR